MEITSKVVSLELLKYQYLLVMKEKFYLLIKNIPQFSRLGLSILFIYGVYVLMPQKKKFDFQYEIARPWLYEDLIAPFDFPIYKSDLELERERESVIQTSKLYFQVNDTLVEKIKTDVYQKLINDSIKEDTILFQKKQGVINSVLDSIYKIGIVGWTEELDFLAPEDAIYLVNSINVESTVTLDNVLNLKIAKSIIESKTFDSNTESTIIRNLQTNITLNRTLTDKFKEERIDEINPYKGAVQKGQVIVEKGQIINEETIKILNSLSEEYNEKYSGEYGTANSIGLLVIIIAFTGVFLYLISIYSLEVIEDIRKLFFIYLLIILQLYLTFSINKIDSLDIYILPFCVVPILIKTFFNTRFAILISTMSILLCAFLVTDPLKFFCMEWIASAVAISAYSNLQRRSQFVYSIFFIFIAYSVVHLSFQLFKIGKVNYEELIMLKWFAFSSVLTLINYPLMYGIEKAFGFISDITLLELSDTNSPLLKRLSEEAPGTFQHSLQVSNLAEAVIQEIGGNPLLVRTGSLYHDIGKLERPEYFSENQHGYNPHDNIGHIESAEIIVNHVIHGIELAKKNNIPEQVIDFIRTHHGTSLIRYFYYSYKKENPDIELDESIFRYPGPLPHSKEAAVLMMADAVEASSRSLPNYNPDAISQLVEKIINSQVEDYQFLNSPLSFKELHKAKNIFKIKLNNIYHSRISYPGV
jgi:hypothetical protein